MGLSLFVGFYPLYDIWTDPKTGKKLFTYAIITCPANGVVGRIHSRMPVILKRENEDMWLNPDITEPEHLKPLLLPYANQEMDCYQRGYEVNNPRNDSEAVIKPRMN